MKRKIILTLFGSLLLSPTFTSEAAMIVIDGKKLEKPSVLRNNTTFIPLRDAADTLGAQVEWDAKEQKITVSLDGKQTVLWANKNTALVGNKSTVLPEPAFIQNGRTLVPIRFVSEAFGKYVQWNETTNTIMVTSSNPDVIYMGGSEPTTSKASDNTSKKALEEQEKRRQEMLEEQKKRNEEIRRKWDETNKQQEQMKKQKMEEIKRELEESQQRTKEEMKQKQTDAIIQSYDKAIESLRQKEQETLQRMIQSAAQNGVNTPGLYSSIQEQVKNQFAPLYEKLEEQKRKALEK